MTTEISYKNEVTQIVSAVFESTMDLPVTLVDAPEAFSWQAEASVSIQGFWNGGLFLRCGAAQVEAWTRRISPVAEPEEEDLRDALGELANMIGGNIKGILPPRNVLSVPAVSLGTGSLEQIAPGQVHCQVYFQEAHGIFCVLLTEDALGSKK